jgi:hypothetical protein
MSGAILLIILVAGVDAEDTTVRAMVLAAREALGPATKIEVRYAGASMSDGAAVSLEESANADAVVELAWKDSARREALLRMHVARMGPWVERSLPFAAQDADAERGRTLGFAIASILPEREEAPPQSARPPPPPPDSVSSANALPAAAIAPTPARRVVRVELRGLATIGIAGVSGGVGGDASAEWLVVRSLGVRGGVGAIGESLGGASVSTTTLRFAGGFTWHPLPPSASRTWDVSLGVDYVFERLSVTYVGSDSTSTMRARWLSGAGVSADLGWLFAPNLEVRAGMGMDDVFSPTYVLVRGVPTLTFPPLRGFGHLGLAVGF